MKQERTLIQIAVLFFVTLFFTGCATIFTGTKDNITFNTKPQGATVYINGVEQCTTPCTKRVTRTINDRDVKFKLDGYETRVITLSKEFNVVSVINLGDLLGWAIDVATGAVMKYDQKVYDITLSKDKTASIKNIDKIKIDTINKTVALYVVQKE